MIESSSKDYNKEATKQEGEHGRMESEKFSNKAIATSRQWTSLRNPRIVRVSRSLGGKDRHSKVCTIRGLRDRRIRLSVPTAIQLYDLQDRLGLSQPSKVVEWLIEATQSDIDKLPPLDIPQSFTQQQTLFQQPGSTCFSLGGGFYGMNQTKGKEAESSEKGNYYNTNYSSNGFPFPYKLDPSSTLSLSQFGSHNHGNLFPSYQISTSGSDMQFSSSSNLTVPNSSGNSQLLLCPSVMPLPSLFTSTLNAPSMESSEFPRQSNHVQILNPSSNGSFIPTIHLPINSPFRRHPTLFSSKLLDSDDNNTRNG